MRPWSYYEDRDSLRIETLLWQGTEGVSFIAPIGPAGTLRILVACLCCGGAAGRLRERFGENVIVTQTRVRITPGPAELSCKRRRRSDRQRFHCETVVEPRLETARERPDPRDAALS
jgi:hypothetical protein